MLLALVVVLVAVAPAAAIGLFDGDPLTVALVVAGPVYALAVLREERGRGQAKRLELAGSALAEARRLLDQLERANPPKSWAAHAVTEAEREQTTAALRSVRDALEGVRAQLARP